MLQTFATVFALRLVRTTKYNVVWVLFIVGFSLLSAERYLQILVLRGKVVLESNLYLWLGIAASVGLSIGVMYSHRLFRYIDRLNRQRQLVSRRILSAVLRAEERSRSRYSKELHDGLGPLLSSAKMSLSALGDNTSDEDRREILENTTCVIDEAIRALREISNNLSPHLLADFGLKKAVQSVIKRNRATHSVDIKFTTNLAQTRYAMDVEVIFYRIVCELINNSLKHSQCTNIDVSLQHKGDTLRLHYHDNGRGFDPLAVADSGMGLSNISSRVSSLGGTLDIKSSKGRGMLAIVKLELIGESQPAPIKKKRRLRKG